MWAGESWDEQPPDCGPYCSSLASPRIRRQNAPASAAVQKLEPTWAFVRARNARDDAIATPNGIDEARYVEAGGIQQWITIRGEDRNNPVLLFLHGGPGDATNRWGYAGFRLWLKHFTVVQWDQRGAGRTFGKNPDAPVQGITVARMTLDGTPPTPPGTSLSSAVGPPDKRPASRWRQDASAAPSPRSGVMLRPSAVNARTYITNAS